jgi:hypothetical protein
MEDSGKCVRQQRTADISYLGGLRKQHFTLQLVCRGLCLQVQHL